MRMKNLQDRKGEGRAKMLLSLARASQAQSSRQTTWAGSSTRKGWPGEVAKATNAEVREGVAQLADPISIHAWVFDVDGPYYISF